MNDSGFGEGELGGEGSGLDGERTEPADSARSEEEHRRQEKRERVLARHPRIGWLLLMLAGAQAHEDGWSRGSDGEKSHPDRGESS